MANVVHMGHRGCLHPGSGHYCGACPLVLWLLCLRSMLLLLPVTLTSGQTLKDSFILICLHNIQALTAAVLHTRRTSACVTTTLLGIASQRSHHCASSFVNPQFTHNVATHMYLIEAHPRPHSSQPWACRPSRYVGRTSSGQHLWPRISRHHLW